ncbi:MAG: hypothetical protein ABI746_05725 [Dermatophilaceae bacterium]
MTQPPTPDEHPAVPGRSATSSMPAIDEPSYERAGHLHPEPTLSDDDETYFHLPSRPRKHLWQVGLALLLAGIIVGGGGVSRLAAISEGTITSAVLLPNDRRVIVQLDEGDHRAIYTTRGGSATHCEVHGVRDAPIPLDEAAPVVLQGAELLWQPEAIFTAPESGDYDITCRNVVQARVGRTVGPFDLGLTALVASLGGIATIAGASMLMVWGVRRRSARRLLK